MASLSIYMEFFIDCYYVVIRQLVSSRYLHIPRGYHVIHIMEGLHRTGIYYEPFK